MLLLLALLGAATGLYRLRRYTLPTPTARLLVALLSGQLLGGLVSLELARRLSAPGTSVPELAAYPFWAILLGTQFLILGAHDRGRFYLAGLACFALAPIMTVDIRLAPLEFGTLLGSVHIWAGFHLRRLRRDD